MNRAIKEVRWGILDLVMVFIGILVVGTLFRLYGNGLFTLVAGWGLPATELTLFILSFLVQFTATIFLVLFFVMINKARLGDLGLKRPSGKDAIKYGFVGGTLLMILVVLLGIPIEHWQPEIEPQVFEQMLRSAGGVSGFMVMLVIGAVLAPISEELYYRGMIYPVFRRYLGPAGGAITAGLIFGIAHWDFWRTLPLAVGGALLCYIYEKTGSLLVSMLAHGTWNGIMSIIVYFSLINF